MSVNVILGVCHSVIATLKSVNYISNSRVDKLSAFSILETLGFWILAINTLHSHHYGQSSLAYQNATKINLETTIF